MEAVFLPFSVCVILPVAIVAIVYAATINNDNKRAKVLIKAIESNCGIDVNKLTETLQKPKKSDSEIRTLRLLRGCIFSFIGLVLCIIDTVYFCIDAATMIFSILGGISIAIGLSYLVVYFVTRNQIKD